MKAIAERFGRELIGENGTLDRPALRARVLANSAALADLNRIVHPEVRRRRLELLAQARNVQGLTELARHLGLGAKPSEPALASAVDFILEGLYAQKKIGRSDDRGFVAPERRVESDADIERLERLRKLKKQVN